MANTKEYVILLGNKARKRHFHEARKGKVVFFVVQLEIMFEGRWKPVLRYDLSYGFSHIDRYNLKGIQKKEVLDLPFKEVLTLADMDINENWQKYKNRFLRGRYP